MGKIASAFIAVREILRTYPAISAALLNAGVAVLAFFGFHASAAQIGIEWVGGVFDEAELAEYYRRARIFIYPSLAERGETFGDAVDHVLLFGRELQPGFFQDLAERGGRFRHLHRLRAGIGDEIARRQPQFVHPAVDILGKVADAL